MFEQSFESTQKTEHSQSVEDELSEAIRDENESNSKLGFGVDANTGRGLNRGLQRRRRHVHQATRWARARRKAREQVHKTTRQQSEKVTTELKQSFKSTFRTVTEEQRPIDQDATCSSTTRSRQSS